MIDIDGTYIPDEEVDKWEYEQDKVKHDEHEDEKEDE